MDNWFNVLCLLALIFLNGIFAMSEIALVTSRKARLQMKIDDGNSGAKVALKLNEEPTRALSAIQVGITSIGILSGIVGEAALATPVAAWLNESFGVEVNTARAVGLLLVVVLVTYFSIVLGELVPKRLGQMNPEGIACRIAPPINFLAVLMAPFVKLLSVSTDLLLKLTGKQNVEEAAVTEEEIHQMVVEGSEAGTIEVQERDIVQVKAGNAYIPVEITVEKQAEALQSTAQADGTLIRQVVDAPGEGFVFGLYNAFDIRYPGGMLPAGTLVATGATDAEGRLTFAGNYPHGDYEVRELQAPEGWKRSPERFPIALEPEGCILSNKRKSLFR